MDQTSLHVILFAGYSVTFSSTFVTSAASMIAVAVVATSEIVVGVGNALVWRTDDPAGVQHFDTIGLGWGNSWV
ncbi:hypothetical protein BDW42DRAFT_191519 [Aspergillus taichungensis]|uniref:Uncharacterized protein n=1 Tax=Aspergillus taichungensis TaxID=482145 RepID=A0A2J5I3U3_9EURO|nr:hypothetical protein BDW42DRAFT_191519 [Aspergillus taichungensis]